MYGFPGVLIQSPAPDWFLVHFHHECGKNFTDVPFCVFTFILAVVGISHIHYVHQRWSVLVRVCELMSDLPPIVWVFTRTPFIMCSVLQVLFSLAQKFNGQRCQCDKSWVWPITHFASVFAIVSIWNSELICLCRHDWNFTPKWRKVVRRNIRPLDFYFKKLLKINFAFVKPSLTTSSHTKAISYLYVWWEIWKCMKTSRGPWRTGR